MFQHLKPFVKQVIPCAVGAVEEFWYSVEVQEGTMWKSTRYFVRQDERGRQSNVCSH